VSTDRELLELAAKAIGHTVLPNASDATAFTLHGCGAYGQRWNPLEDDGDALRLAVRLGLGVITHMPDGKAAARKPSGAVVTEFAPDMFLQTRRAIVRAAAEIGRETR